MLREPHIKERKYTVSKDGESGMWYAHMVGYSYIPVFGSISPDKSVARQYANLYNGKTNHVADIEAARREQEVEFINECDG